MAARTAWRGVAAGWLCGFGLLAAAQAQTSQAADTYARVQREREALAQEHYQAEAACYQRFAVEDCLSDARKRHRQALAQLRQQEQDMRAQERQQQQRERAQALQDKQQAHPPARPAAPPPALLVREREQAQAERARTAGQRVQQQHTRQQAQQVRAAQRAAQAGANEAAARAQFQEKQQAAQQRRSRYAQAQQERQASGKPPAADLPVPSAAATSAASAP